MSQFLACIPGRVVSLGATIQDVHDYLRKDLTEAGWQVVKEEKGATPTRLFVVPPVSEAIGNEQVREVLLIQVDGASITWKPVSEALKAFPQTLFISPKTGGKVAAEITIGTVKVTQAADTLADANTAAQNLRFLYEALCASQDGQIQDWIFEYSYPAPENADDGNPYIFGVRQTLAPNITIAPGANVNGGTLGNYAAPGIQDQQIVEYPHGSCVTIDLTNGFLYFLQINKRGLALATRTVKGYSGPIHACYGDHALALAAVPKTGIWQAFVSPIELIVGSDGAADSLDSAARPAKCYGFSPVPQALVPKLNLAVSNDPSKPSGPHPFSSLILRHVIHDYAVVAHAQTGKFDMTTGLKSSGIFWNDEGLKKTGNDFQIHRVTMSGSEIKYKGIIGYDDYGNLKGLGIPCFIPAISIEDWYKFHGTAVDENLQFCADSAPATTLKTDLERLATYTAIELESAAGLPPKGLVIIEGEAIEYTGLSGNTLTGCTRAKYATKQEKHFKGCPVFLGLWFIKINGGAIFAGHQKPA